MDRFTKFALACAFGLSAATVAVADAGHGDSAAKAENHGGHGAAHGAASDKPASGHSLIDGEVRKVDKDAGKITIKHGPIPERDMPGMTMVFRVSEPAMLEQVKAGDKVKFQGDKVNGAFTLVKLEVVK